MLLVRDLPSGYQFYWRPVPGDRALVGRCRFRLVHLSDNGVGMTIVRHGDPSGGAQELVVVEQAGHRPQ